MFIRMPYMRTDRLIILSTKDEGPEEIARSRISLLVWPNMCGLFTSAAIAYEHIRSQITIR